MTMAGNFSPLVLVGDSDRVEAEAVGAYLDNWAGKDGLRLATADAIKAILAGATRLAGRIARGSLPGDPGKLVGVNSDQDQQKCIDVGSHNLFVELLIAAGGAPILLEETEPPLAGKGGQGRWADCRCHRSARRFGQCGPWRPAWHDFLDFPG